jgi:hypothetical protein
MFRRKFCPHIHDMNALVCGFLAYDEYVILESGYRLAE